MNNLVFGKDDTENIVGCEVKDDTVELFIQQKDGEVVSELCNNNYWVLSPGPINNASVRLEGNLHYKYINTYTDLDSFKNVRRLAYKKDYYSVADEKESAMIYNGFTYFKGMKTDDVSVLAFDIESTSLTRGQESKTLLISNTFRHKGITIRKLFAYDAYSTPAGLFDDWCAWVREINPSIIVGHNIFMYDLPYLDFCAREAGTSLNLGRNGSEIKFAEYTSNFRKDGTQFYEYNKVFIYGREIVDTLFLSYKSDIQRKYENYGLKNIIKQEGLEVVGRQFYDASKIKDTYKDPAEWKLIKSYAEHDADDALALYDLMIPAFFYLTQSVPKSFQNMILTASGSQINSILVRSYLQDGHSIPKASIGETFEGGLSDGFPGIYSNVIKFDVKSMYPSIMLQYKIYDEYKDPKANFNQMLEYFTLERFENKRKSKETGERYYQDMEQSNKQIINSSYGLLGATGLNFNSFNNASFVTQKGRETLKFAIKWATGMDYERKN